MAVWADLSGCMCARMISHDNESDEAYDDC